jgi:ribosomal protein S18 acetylase RimI-like enzyme
MYLGYLDGVPVSSNFLIYGEDVVGLYKIATLPDYGRRGIGTALTLMPLYDARDKGYTIAILQSSGMGINLYKRLGFKEDGVQYWYMFTWADQVKTL